MYSRLYTVLYTSKFSCIPKLVIPLSFVFYIIVENELKSPKVALSSSQQIQRSDSDKSEGSSQSSPVAALEEKRKKLIPKAGSLLSAIMKETVSRDRSNSKSDSGGGAEERERAEGASGGAERQTSHRVKRDSESSTGATAASRPSGRERHISSLSAALSRWPPNRARSTSTSSRGRRRASPQVRHAPALVRLTRSSPMLARTRPRPRPRLRQRRPSARRSPSATTCSSRPPNLACNTGSTSTTYSRRIRRSITRIPLSKPSPTTLTTSCQQCTLTIIALNRGAFRYLCEPRLNDFLSTCTLSNGFVN